LSMSPLHTTIEHFSNSSLIDDSSVLDLLTF
jgi:hypothetical protein